MPIKSKNLSFIIWKMIVQNSFVMFVEGSAKIESQWKVIDVLMKEENWRIIKWKLIATMQHLSQLGIKNANKKKLK